MQVGVLPFCQHSALWTSLACLVVTGVVAAQQIVGKGESECHLSAALRSAKHQCVWQSVFPCHLCEPCPHLFLSYDVTFSQFFSVVFMSVLRAVFLPLPLRSQRLTRCRSGCCVCHVNAVPCIVPQPIPLRVVWPLRRSCILWLREPTTEVCRNGTSLVQW